MKIKTALSIAIGAALPLLIPLIAMQFSDEVRWSVSDFALMWVLFAGAALCYVFVASRSKSMVYQAASALTVLTALVLIWMNGAVGIIGSEDNPANLLYGAVIATLFLGSILVWFRARGMMYVAGTAALAQLLVPLVAFLIWQPPLSADLLRVIAISSFFAVLWAGAALLYRRAAG